MGMSIKGRGAGENSLLLQAMGTSFSKVNKGLEVLAESGGGDSCSSLLRSSSIGLAGHLKSALPFLMIIWGRFPGCEK